MTKSTVAETSDKVDCRRYGRSCCQYGRLYCRYGWLCCWYGRLFHRFWRQICNNWNSIACCGRQYCQLCRLCRQHGRLCHPYVERPFDFVASVYRALICDCVEFNFVTSVYRALICDCCPHRQWNQLSSKSMIGKSHKNFNVRFNCLFCCR